MYLCVEKEGTAVWFEPQARSLFEIAAHNITVKQGKNILVKLYNIHKYEFSIGKKYYLFLERDNMNNLQITLKFNELDYVADMYRMPIATLPEKWGINTICLSEEEEFISDENIYMPDVEEYEESDSESDYDYEN